MPQILVTAGPTDQHGGGEVMLRERVNSADFESERFAVNLVERLGWAVLDATEVEQHPPSEPELEAQPPAAPEPEPAAPRHLESMIRA